MTYLPRRKDDKHLSIKKITKRPPRCNHSYNFKTQIEIQKYNNILIKQGNTNIFRLTTQEKDYIITLSSRKGREEKDFSISTILFYAHRIPWA